MRLDLPGLEAFLSIAERGSFHAAASHLNLSQTALSHRLRKLEELVGVQLIARTTRNLALTPAGVELLPKARRMVEDMSATFERLRMQARQSNESVSIGCLPTIAIRCLPVALARFRTDYPDTAVHVHDNSASEIADKVQSGDAAFGITIVAANRWNLDLKPIARERFVLVCRRDQPLASSTSLTWTQMENLPLVRISAETGNRILIDDALGARKDRLIWRYEVQRVTTAVSLVRSGIGYAIVPQLAIDVGVETGLVAIPLGSPAISRLLGVITRQGTPMVGAAARLLEHMCTALHDTVGSSLSTP